tara:strand:- start:456 stop:692 length:237 start_codon:yes stop_codon:yes gene_type:complete
MDNTYNIKIDKVSLNKLSTGLYFIKGFTDTGAILELKSNTKNQILELINPLSINERIDIIKEIGIELDEELSTFSEYD